MSNKFDIFNHVSISAGAGSGKTYTLSRRYINILVGFNLFFEGEDNRPVFELLKPSRPGEIVTITYTEAGALEMKSRIYALIQNVIAYIDGDFNPEHTDYKSIQEAFAVLRGDVRWISHIRNVLENSLTELSSATISTIHSYCLELIEQYGDYLKLDAKPKIVGDDEKIVAYTDAYRQILNSEAELIKEINQTISLYKLSQIAQKYSFNAQFREAFNTYAHLCDDTSFSLRDVWMATLLPSYKETIENGFYASRALVEQDASKSDYVDAILGNLKSVLVGEGEWMEYPGQFRKNKNIEEETFESVKRFKKVVDDLRWTKVDPDAESHYFQTLKSIHALFVKVYDRFRQSLSDEGYTDFETILQQANTLLEHNITLPARYFMVDEFQDTNSYQWGIITKAAAKNKANVFIVGDEKQSIFAFQGADVSVFAQASGELGIDKPISMEINRRSDRAIIDFVNDVFAPAMADREAIRFKTIAPLQEAKIDSCIELFNQYADFSPIKVDFEAKYDKLSSPEEKGEGTLAILATPVEHTLPDCEDECSESLQELRHIASFIDSVIRGEHPQYADVKKAYDEGKKAIAILFDSRKFMLPLKQRLLELGIRAKVSDSGNLFDTKEVNDIFIVLKLLSLMDRLDWKNLTSKTKYVLVGALRSNILRCSADEIESTLRTHDLPVDLQRWKQLTFYKPIHEMIEVIVQESRLLHFYRHIEGYEQREANIEQLITMAYEYSTHSGSDFKGFVDELEAFIHNENVSEDEAFVIEDGVGSIEIVTMHGSKGLEWPMVIIGSMNRSFLGMSKQETLVYDRFEEKEMIGFKIGDYEPLVYKFIKDRINQKHIAERKRLFYVAMTRPEHHLVLSTAINNYKSGPRLCYNCGSNNYFTLINNVLGIDYTELYKTNIDKVHNIDVFYPQEWKGDDVGVPQIDVVAPVMVEPKSFTRQTTIRPSGKIDPFSFLDDDTFDAGNAGTVVHKILEKHWHELDRDDIFENYFTEYTVPESFKNNIIRMTRNFCTSEHYKKLKEGVEGYFEHDFVMIQEGNRIRGSIDLFYFDKEANGWVIVDFKTTALRGKEPDTVIRENGYDVQLDMYEQYLSSVVDEKIVSKDICWLNT
ncbi:UvrD-helicase domain-containing protein [Sulfuricurvum sp.]|uniref:UvrD-helicase domain-containing protein n=1 Tax=Sulfuricurvum sp. TaxID=2025608 RepID=UPI00260FD9F6|nr:UvrD-helicase domain-containing protein [Sulfuricurvum sp.]MDD3596500.1 UvrD-helicase domain-containing protein [Sulfuricurvum sp.]